jgi:hypothetical protein
LKGKGKFSKKQRITFTESILNEGKAKGSPGPGAYDHLKFDGGIGGPVKEEGKSPTNGFKSEKVCAFIEEARYRGSSTPAHNYEIVHVKHLSIINLFS